MAETRKNDVTEANRRISRPDDERGREGREGKVFAGQRYEYAESPLGDEASRKSEGEKALERASRNDGRAGNKET